MTTLLYNTRLCPSASFAYFLLIRVLYIAMHSARCCLTMPLFVSCIPSQFHASSGVRRLIILRSLFSDSSGWREVKLCVGDKPMTCDKSAQGSEYGVDPGTFLPDAVTWSRLA